MKVCVTATSGSLDAQVDPRFGRCQYFVIVDPDTMTFEALSNASIMASSGAGIQAAQTIANKGVEAIITGNVGPNAFQTLSAAGIKIITGAYGTVRDAIEMYKSGRLQSTAGPTAAAHAGMGAGVGTGIGTGMGGGMGMGRGGGRGMGRGMGMGMRQMPTTPPVTPQPQTKEQEIQTLSEQAGALEEQLKQIKKRLEELK
jgi:predicted Fe-Mo cluster-binding NifX family protein